MKYILSGAMIVVGDQISKLVISANMLEGQSIPVLPPVLYITYVRNPGAAFGLFANQTLLLILAAVVAAGLAWHYRSEFAEQGLRTKWGVALALAGALGNLTDRIRLGYVIDFLDIPVWPVFNVADMAIVAGVALLFWEVLTSGKQEKS